MIDHISIQVGDIEQARSFYDRVMTALGATRLMSFERGEVKISGYGRNNAPAFWIAQVSGNSTLSHSGHIAFAAVDRGSVDGFHAAALAGGASDNGAPGLRPDYHENYYAAFLIDPDGNRLEAVCHKPA